MNPILLAVIAFGVGILLGPFVLDQIKKLQKKND